MRLFTLSFIVFACVLSSSPPAASVAVGTALHVLSVSTDVVLWIAKTWKAIDPPIQDFSQIPLPFQDKSQQLLFYKIDTMTQKLNQMETEAAVGSSTISMLLSNLPDRMRLELRLNDLLIFYVSVDIYYRLMEDFVKYKDEIEKATLENFANRITSHDPGSVTHLVEQIYNYIVPTSTGITDTGILDLLTENLQEVHGGMLCESQQSPQQVVLNLYNSIAVTELKGYAMVQFAYMLKKLYGHGNFTKEFELAQERYQERTKLIAESVRRAMERSSRELWKCDPKKHVLGKTYEEVTQLLQGYIQNEVDLNSEGTCRENCAEYTYTKSHGCYQNQWCNKQRKCNGKIVNCQYIDSDMWICPSSSLERRYEYVEYENGRVLGRKQSCRKGTTKVDSWWRWIFWHCSYCFCFCDEQGANSDRYINLRPAIADIKNNKVVTGLRFVKQNRIIHLQIQEGTLLPRGRVDRDSVQWVPIESYKITDKNIRNGQDYHTLTWEKRAIDLDDLLANEGHVVTGVKFKMIGSHLNFEIQSTPFDFETGNLIDPEVKSLFKDNPNTDSAKYKPRTRVKLTNPDVPTRTVSPSVPDSEHDQYIEFINSDMDRDAAQTTVPFFDAQPVESVEPVPLSGAGIFHKGQKYFGGFIAPKIITLDYSKHIQVEAPNDEPPVN